MIKGKVLKVGIFNSLFLIETWNAVFIKLLRHENYFCSFSCCTLCLVAAKTGILHLLLLEDKRLDLLQGWTSTLRLAVKEQRIKFFEEKEYTFTKVNYEISSRLWYLLCSMNSKKMGNLRLLAASVSQILPQVSCNWISHNSLLVYCR